MSNGGTGVKAFALHMENPDLIPVPTNDRKPIQEWSLSTKFEINLEHLNYNLILQKFR